MSGIVGLFYLDGRPVDPDDLTAMVDILAHRGPDGASIWHDGPVGLGHRMLHTTPESLTESLPWSNERGDLVITADARIDNRGELISRLRLDDRPASAITDSQLILAAYEQWGERCPDHLLGDFAFAVWDGRKRRLFCGRDHFGVRPFYYHCSDRVFVFASEIKAILALGTTPRAIDETRVADYLVGLFDDTESTFYRAIRRLAPGHSMLVASENPVQLHQYGLLEMPDERRLGTAEEYVEAFRELFMEAVRCRLRAAQPVGVLLSGGLDSAAVTVAAAKLAGRNGRPALHAFSGLFDHLPACDERRYIRQALDGTAIQAHEVSVDGVGPLTDIERVLWHQDEPFYAPHLFMRWLLQEHARGAGIRVLLDGYDGDTTVSHGSGYLRELAHAGKWKQLAENLRQLAPIYGESFPRMFVAYAWKFSWRPYLLRSPFLQNGRRLWRHRPPPRLDIPAAVAPDSHFGLPRWSAPIATRLAQNTGVAERYRRWNRTRPERAETEREHHYRMVQDGRHAFSLEVLNKAAAAFQLEIRHPYWDKRLVEFCLALPADHKLKAGYGRLILRRAMNGQLAPDIQWRRDKTSFLPSFSHGLFVLQRQQLDRLLDDGLDRLDGYVDVAAFLSQYHRVAADPARASGYDFLALWQVVSLALWLNGSSTSEALTFEGGGAIS